MLGIDLRFMISSQKLYHSQNTQMCNQPLSSADCTYEIQQSEVEGAISHGLMTDCKEGKCRYGIREFAGRMSRRGDCMLNDHYSRLQYPCRGLGLLW